MKLFAGAKRACIYFLYDKEGIVDRYVFHTLSEMKKNAEYVHCVVNGKLRGQDKSRLLEIIDEVHERENVGNDIGAYKAAIKKIGWEKLATFDELIIMNFTCFGPVYPFEELFDWSNEKDVDVWGLTWDRKSGWLGDEDYCHKNARETFFQSYFCGIRKPLLGSDLLKDFYDEIPENATYLQSGNFYEYAFPGYFEEKGYKSAVLCDDLDDFNYPLLNNPIDLLRKYHMPLIKKRSFFHHYTDILRNTGGEATSRLLKYLTKHTEYDISMIWESILRLYSLSDIVRISSLNRILPEDVMLQPDSQSLKAGLLFVFLDERKLEEDIEYIDNFEENIDILIITDTEEKKDKLVKSVSGNNVEIFVANSHENIIENALLVYGKSFVDEHDLICFGHDRVIRDDILYSVEESYDYKLKETLFSTNEYIKNVIAMFEAETSLGIAFPSPLNDDFYGNNIGNAWCGYYGKTRELLDQLEINVKTNPNTLCVAPIDSCFWFRKEALVSLYKGINGVQWTVETVKSEELAIEVIARTCAYCAQKEGYYPSYLYTNRSAEVDISNLEFYKTGSQEMRAWVDLITLDAIGYQKIEEVFKKPVGYVTRDDVINFYYKRTYSVKQCLELLSDAVKRKYPKVWKLFLPVRFVAKKMLKKK